MLYTSAQTAYNLLENLTEWSRTLSGNIKFSPIPQNLFPLIEGVVELLANHAFTKHITLHNTVDKNLVWNLDSNLLKTIIRNLVSNAIKFTREGGFVKISAEIQNNTLVICIEDNGIGIKHDQLPYLFTGKTTSTAGTANEQGTGLGLKICKDFVALHKGNIRVESIEGVGAKFFIELPA
jgi:signal transduction histidine kinase